MLPPKDKKLKERLLMTQKKARIHPLIVLNFQKRKIILIVVNMIEPLSLYKELGNNFL